MNQFIIPKNSPKCKDFFPFTAVLTKYFSAENGGDDAHIVPHGRVLRIRIGFRQIRNIPRHGRPMAAPTRLNVVPRKR